MTREEAIEVMNAYRDKVINSASNQLDGDVEALDMAIKALKQELMPTIVYPQVEGITPTVVLDCDRNICIKNEYNGIGCDECEVTKSQESKTGHWLEHPTKEDYSVCSCCGIGCKRKEHGENADGTEYIEVYSYRFCPWCGVRMFESQESEG